MKEYNYNPYLSGKEKAPDQKEFKDNMEKSLH